MTSVLRLLARARLDDAAALDRAREEAAGGDEWREEWIAQYERGEAAVITLELELEIGDRRPETINARSEGLFVELDANVPKVERQIAELASGEVAALTQQITARGHEVDVDELGEMYVHVELDPELRAALAGRNRLTDQV